MVGRNWPDGPVCSGCVAKAVETFGICDECGVERMLPGRGPDGQRWCTDCGGGLGDFTCMRCRREGWREQRGVCGWCILGDRVAELLDDGTSRIRPELEPLAELICSMDRPRSGLRWLSRPAPCRILRALAVGQVPLTHEGVHSLPAMKSSIYVRDLMVACGILPPVDRFLFLFEQWWPEWLASIADAEHRRLLHHFITWRVLRQFRQKTGPLGYAAPQLARRRLRVAAAFLEDLDARSMTLVDLSQSELDSLYADMGESDRACLRPFLQWLITTRHMPGLQLAPLKQTAITLITQQQRVELIRRVYYGTDMELTDRVLALLMLLYAQPLARVQRLTIDDVTVERDGTMRIALGNPPTPVPAPFDEIIRRHIIERSNQMTATNAEARWMFPGRRAGEPLHPTSIRLRLRNLGIPRLTNRNRAIRELLRQAPPLIVAGMLGYSRTGADRIATEYGTAWTTYPHTVSSTKRPSVTVQH